MTAAPLRGEVLLEARAIVKEFPGVRALDRVDFKLSAGEVHALVGENGAGKSTLVNILNGGLRPDRGTILVGGQPATFGSSSDARAAGIRAIHQELAFVPHLDVATNLNLGDIPVRRGLLSWLVGGIVDRAALRRHAEDALSTVGHPVTATLRAERLSVAQAQLLEIARALASRFQIILFDEPTSSIGPVERDTLFRHIRALRQRGVGILYISHRLPEVLEIADRITVLRDGRVVGTNTAAAFDLDRIAQLMTGKTPQIAVRRRHQGAEAALQIRGLTSEPGFRDVSLVLREGEIVGLTGLVGAGRTELARCLYGAAPIGSGEIELAGQQVRPGSPRAALALGIAYATEDRKIDGVLHARPVRDNVVIGAFARPELARMLVGRTGWLDQAAIGRLVQPLIERLDLRPPDQHRLAGTLSGGNQQKVVFARLIASKPRVLILDEPTRGIDVGAKAAIWQLIHELADEGAAILAISSELEELQNHADRILVMRRGELVGELTAGHSEAEVMRLAV